MAKTNDKKNPELEGGVNRAVDFSLKKEDLMLLILEGRKEIMEERISEIQKVSDNLRKECQAAEEVFRKKILKLATKTLNAEAKKIAKAFAPTNNDELLLHENDDSDELADGFNIYLSSSLLSIDYTKYICAPIGVDNKNSTYIKKSTISGVQYTIYHRMKLTFSLSLQGKTFINKNDLFGPVEVKACSEYRRDFEVANQALDRNFLEKLPEYKAIVDIATKLAENESLLSDVLAEYDLFNRNQPRAKAKMIKEVLARDEAGQALLGNIITAASGVKLLATSEKDGQK